MTLTSFLLLMMMKIRMRGVTKPERLRPRWSCHLNLVLKKKLRLNLLPRRSANPTNLSYRVVFTSERMLSWPRLLKDSVLLLAVMDVSWLSTAAIRCRTVRCAETVSQLSWRKLNGVRLGLKLLGKGSAEPLVPLLSPFPSRRNPVNTSLSCVPALIAFWERWPKNRVIRSPG